MSKPNTSLELSRGLGGNHRDRQTKLYHDTDGELSFTKGLRLMRSIHSTCREYL
jgi:hypothetical protein